MLWYSCVYVYELLSFIVNYLVVRPVPMSTTHTFLSCGVQTSPQRLNIDEHCVLSAIYGSFHMNNSEKQRSCYGPGVTQCDVRVLRQVNLQSITVIMPHISSAPYSQKLLPTSSPLV